MKKYVAGSGRRNCPRRELADASLLMYVAMRVAVLDLRKPVKEMKGFLPRKEWVTGMIMCVFPSFCFFIL